MKPSEYIDKAIPDDKALLRFAMLLRKALLMAEEDEQCKG